jgi:hypothetical protein
MRQFLFDSVENIVKKNSLIFCRFFLIDEEISFASKRNGDMSTDRPHMNCLSMP